jgi:hypothetical protein
MLKINTEQKVHYTLRIACALCFIGHGSFGIITKTVWCNYFSVFGIGEALSFKLMPFVGAFDILCGILILIYPIRAVVLWLVIWGFITALLRPLSGEPFAEFIERFGNFGTPLALLILSGGIGRNFKSLFSPIKINTSIDEKALANMATVLRFVVFFLFLGHGCLNLMEKKSLLNQYMALGFIYPADVAQAIGLFEIVTALSVLVRPFRFVLLTLLIWKISSELFYPHHELFEWIERSGSYGAVLGLWFALESASPQYKFSYKRNSAKKESYFLTD